MYVNGEIYKVMDSFEKFLGFESAREKDKEWHKKGQWYENGEVNQKFKFYLSGYSLGKLSERLGEYA